MVRAAPSSVAVFFLSLLALRELERQSARRRWLRRRLLGLFEPGERVFVDFGAALVFELAAGVDEVLVKDLRALFGERRLDEAVALLVVVHRVCVLAGLGGDDDPLASDLDGSLRHLARLERVDGRVKPGVCAGLAERATEFESVLVFGLDRKSV